MIAGISFRFMAIMLDCFEFMTTSQFLPMMPRPGPAMVWSFHEPDCCVCLNSSLLDRDRTVAPPGFNRWLIPPAALAVHLCIGEIYGFSVFNGPLTRVVGDHATRSAGRTGRSPRSAGSTRSR